VADLIAQGPEPQDRWRRPLPPGQPVVLGRGEGGWSIKWDGHISRRHCTVTWSEGRLEVEKLPTARNPIFVHGEEVNSVVLRPGEHFVIGQTTFWLADEQVSITMNAPQPLKEQTFSAQYLQQIRFRNADHRIEVLSRLPEVISGAAGETELFVRLVNMLLVGIPRASAVALVSVDPTHVADAPVKLLHWDRRLATSGDFQPSERLIREALRRQQSVLHVWEGQESMGIQFTMSEGHDWAFCTPVTGEACAGWSIYATGRFDSFAPAGSTPSESTDLRDDLKFTELVAAILSSLRQVHLLQRKQASLSQFFAPAVLDSLRDTDPEIALHPRETDVSVLFCDLRGFSRRSEQSADDLLGLLKRVSNALGVMTQSILDEGGVVGDFHGDAAMGFWGWPIAHPDIVERACRAALSIRAQFEAASGREGHPLADFRIGIGVATGRAVAGKIGTQDQVKVTVFGPVVNLASRLEGMTKTFSAPILLDEPTAQVMRERMPPTLARCRRIAVVKPYGLETPLIVHELLPPVEEYPLLQKEHLEAYEAALDAFLAGEWPEAFELLHQVPARDRVKDFLTVFIAQHNRTPPPEWDGVIRLASKGV